MPGIGRTGGILPFGFRPGPVTAFISAFYVFILGYSLIVHHSVPKIVEQDVPATLNLEQAWQDLHSITQQHHPYNSHANDIVRQWLLSTIQARLEADNVPHEIISSASLSTADPPPLVTVFDDRVSDAVIARMPETGAYFEGNNIIVQIRGYGNLSSGAVLVNAHFDSVSTGFGATDDGVGVVSILQLISYFTDPANRPHRDIILLLNNGEEDYLQGAYAFLRHPVSHLARTFVNLEGAGAGGRAILFRSTDYEVTKAYEKVPFPLGSVLTRDAFDLRIVRSQTDYVVFNGNLGLRGLDIAFFGPRSQYHSSQDSVNTTSRESIWHMLSAVVAATSHLAADRSATFDGPDFKNGRVHSGHGSPGVWWDLFGRRFVIFQLRPVFIVSVVSLVLAPVILMFLHAALIKRGQWYLWDGSTHMIDTAPFESTAVGNAVRIASTVVPPPVSEADGSRADGFDSRTQIGTFHMSGWAGFFRTPICLGFSGLATYAVSNVFLRLNQYIVSSHEYFVWGALIGTFFSCYYWLSQIGNMVRESALVRVYSLIWLFAISWLLLLVNTVVLGRLELAGGYPILVLYLTMSISTMVSYLEFFALPTKTEYKKFYPVLKYEEFEQYIEQSADQIVGSSQDDDLDMDSQTEETTSLLGRTLTGSVLPIPLDVIHTEQEKYDVFGNEQIWSGRLPKWTWLIQFLLLVPINLTVLANMGLILTTALHQTPSDGSPVELVYHVFAALAVLACLPAIPFIHRLSAHVPVLVTVTVFSLLALSALLDPFDAQARVIVRFSQTVDLDTGVNSVKLRGLEPFTSQIVGLLPSAQTKQVICDTPPGSMLLTMKDCTWPGLPPRVLNADETTTNYGDYLDLRVRRTKDTNDNFDEAIIELAGNNTRGCRVFFDKPVSAFSVLSRPQIQQAFVAQAKTDSLLEAYSDGQFDLPGLPDGIGQNGMTELRLWTREWNHGWAVKVRWPKGDSPPQTSRVKGGLDDQGPLVPNDPKLPDDEPVSQPKLSGHVMCFWSDQNDPGSIPALSELHAYIPAWAGVLKMDDGLVEATKRFGV